MTDSALIFDIKRSCSEDGPGIRTTVFFKGCPLACQWCQNPEGKRREPEYDLNGETIGGWITLDELLYRVSIDKPFFQSSGGGVTLSGGEPTMQMAFNHRFLQRLKSDGIHTAIETCGLFNYNHFREVLLPYLDLIYFDLKLFDDEASRRYTGRSNRPILKNFSRLVADAKIPIVPRIPLIPGITDTEYNLSSLTRLIRQNGIEACTLIPYNPLWHDKINRLGISPAYHRKHFMSPEEQSICISHIQ